MTDPSRINTDPSRFQTERTWRGRVFIATSLDGFIARPDGDIAWLTNPREDVTHPAPLHDEEVGGYESFMASVDHIVMGRTTYETVLGFDGWPYPDHRVVVLSTTLAEDVDERVSVVRSVAGAVRALTDAGSRGAYIDGGRVIQSFLAADLIDELTITHVPVLLGAGLPLFGALDHDRQLSLQATGVSANGLTHARYDVVR